MNENSRQRELCREFSLKKSVESNKLCTRRVLSCVFCVEEDTDFHEGRRWNRKKGVLSAALALALKRRGTGGISLRLYP